MMEKHGFPQLCRALEHDGWLARCLGKAWTRNTAAWSGLQCGRSGPPSRLRSRCSKGMYFHNSSHSFHLGGLAASMPPGVQSCPYAHVFKTTTPEGGLQALKTTRQAHLENGHHHITDSGIQLRGTNPTSGRTRSCVRPWSPSCFASSALWLLLPCGLLYPWPRA